MVGWVGLIGWTVAHTKWTSVMHRSGTGQGKSAGQRPTSLPLSYTANAPRLQLCSWARMCVHLYLTVWQSGSVQKAWFGRSACSPAAPPASLCREPAKPDHATSQPPTACPAASVPKEQCGTGRPGRRACVWRLPTATVATKAKYTRRRVLSSSSAMNGRCQHNSELSTVEADCIRIFFFSAEK